MPIKWENNVLGFVPRTDWLDIPFQVTRPNDPADLLFGDRRTENLVAEWVTIASEYQIPVMAHFHGFDTEANTTFRVPVDMHNIEKGLIKTKLNQSERMRALLNNGVQRDEALYDYVINDGVRLAEQVVTRTKVAKNELLATGKITIKENDLDLTVDYGVPDANVAYTLDFGAGATDDIPTQIQNIIDAAKTAGQTITGIFTSSKMLTKMRRDANIQKLVYGNMGIGAQLRTGDLEAYLSEDFGINQVITNDLTYGASATIAATGRPSITTGYYYPRNKITFFASNAGGNLGVGLWGDPPETDVRQLMDVSGSGTSPYVYITQWTEEDPAVLWTKASALFMPVLYNPNSLFIATNSSDTPAGA